MQKRGKFMSHGGARPGAGRKPTGRKTTKATIYEEDRELINNYATSMNIPVNELLHRIFRHENFVDFINKLK